MRKKASKARKMRTEESQKERKMFLEAVKALEKKPPS